MRIMMLIWVGRTVGRAAMDTRCLLLQNKSTQLQKLQAMTIHYLSYQNSKASKKTQTNG